MKLCTAAPLDAVAGPECLRPAVQLNRFKRTFPGVTPGKGNVIRRVPVLGRDDHAEESRPHQPHDRFDDQIAFRDGERAPRHEVRLYIDQKQGGIGRYRECHTLSPRRARSQKEMEFRGQKLPKDQPVLLAPSL